jgi:hypothetical protein
VARARSRLEREFPNLDVHATLERWRRHRLIYMDGKKVIALALATDSHQALRRYQRLVGRATRGHCG